MRLGMFTDVNHSHCGFRLFRDQGAAQSAALRRPSAASAGGPTPRGRHHRLSPLSRQDPPREYLPLRAGALG